MVASLGQGSVVVPVPASGKTACNGTRISKEEASFIKIGQTTRAEVVNRFGQPFVIQEKPEAIAYNWAVVSWYWCLVTILPDRLFDGGITSERSEVFMLQFDSEHRVRSLEFRRLSERQSVAEVLCRWTK